MVEAHESAYSLPAMYKITFLRIIMDIKREREKFDDMVQSCEHEQDDEVRYTTLIKSILFECVNRPCTVIPLRAQAAFGTRKIHRWNSIWVADVLGAAVPLEHGAHAARSEEHGEANERIVRRHDIAAGSGWIRLPLRAGDGATGPFGSPLGQPSAVPRTSLQD